MQSVRRFLNGRLFLVVFAAFVFLIDILTSFPALKDSSDVMLSHAPEVLLKQQLQVSCVLFLCVMTFAPNLREFAFLRRDNPLSCLGSYDRAFCVKKLRLLSPFYGAPHDLCDRAGLCFRCFGTDS